MDRERLADIIDGVIGGRVSREEALEALGTIDYEDLGFARLDHHRALRTGVPEVIFCQGKSDEHIAAIFARLADTEKLVIGTRLA
ncbi:MAG: 1-(5-phosphoribosyl)-5-amino-4-imidazole-carboxylate carboxylase, partial [Abditibacteriota bacterium]|nr:1-(5-phosphoribosyl)-5-amino-4-imidazole-carboxylate carboxylase [Abditibacteriota bacterium]